jgi:mycothiol synthase
MMEMEPVMDTKFQTDETILAPDLKLRSAQWNDVEAVAQLIYDVCEADGDTTVAVTPEELKLEWQAPGFNLERDAFLVETPAGRIVGYEEFNNRHMHATLETDGYVHPDFRGRGIGTSLLRTVEKRAWEEMSLAQPDVRVSLRSGIDNRDQASHDLHKNEGYQPLRYYWRMEINLTTPPALTTFPEGIELRPFAKDEHARAVLDAQNEAFRDH